MKMRKKDIHIFSVVLLIIIVSLLIAFLLTSDTDILAVVTGAAIMGCISWYASILHIREDLTWKKTPELTANVKVTNITSVVGGTSLSVSTEFHVRFDFLDLDDIHQVFPLNANEKGGMMEGEQGVLTYKHLTTKKGSFVHFISFQAK